MAIAHIPNSTTNAVASFFPVILQALLIITSAIDASRTSHLKARWLVSQRSKGLKSIFQYVPYKTIVLSIMYFLAALTISICRTFGALGFTKLPELRKNLIYAFYLQSILQPIVALGTVSRMARRLERRSTKNRKIAARRSGILEPGTVHGQGLKVHFADIDGKASLLYALQMQAISARSNDQERGDVGRSDLQPEEVFAAGVVLSHTEPSEFQQFKLLMKNLKSIYGIQRYRLIAQGVIFLVFFIMLGIFSEKEWIREKTESITLMNTCARATMFMSGAIFGGFYEVFAPSLADQSERPILVAFFWVLLQIWLFLYPLSIAVHGNIKKGIVYEEVLVFLTGISCLLEVVMSESWIAKARNEAQSLKVPSWMELAILTGYDPDAEGADRRFKGGGEIEDMK